jgi:hypothetical protein
MINQFELSHAPKLKLLARVLISYILFLFLIITFNKQNPDRLSSFYIVNISAVIAIFLLSFGLNKKVGFNVFAILIVGYLLKILIGYLFWEFYLFPDYFSYPESVFKFDHMEYLYTESLMKEYAQQRMDDGFFYFVPQMAFYKHFEIHYFMSNLYLSGSFHPFDLAVQNSFFSIYTAIIVLGISNLLGANSKQMQFALILAVFQPFSMISSTIWRDVVGQCFVTLGGYLTVMAFSKKTAVAFLLIVLGALSMYIQRFNYFFFPFLIYGAFLVLRGNKKILFILPVLLLFVLFVNARYGLISGIIDDYGGNLTSFSLWLLLPLNIIRLFIGPFPWINWFDFNDNTIFLIADYFESVFLISMMILFLKKLRTLYIVKIKIPLAQKLLLVLFVLFILSGFATVEIHQGYMSTGAVFLIPILAVLIGMQKFIEYSYIVFVLFIFVNVLYFAFGLRGMGIGSSIR